VREILGGEMKDEKTIKKWIADLQKIVDEPGNSIEAA
jgi:hypothetical protein